VRQFIHAEQHLQSSTREAPAMPTYKDSTDETAIRRLRSQSNAAIERHDVDGARAVLHEDARFIVSNGDLYDGAAAMARAFAERFADPDFVTFVRDPASIEVDDETAAEAGSWVGQWKHGNVVGRYLARWRRESAGWRIVAELFIPLGRSSAE
jgi:ketosteroid isomerase-like protein